MVKINNFRGDLTDISAKKEALVIDLSKVRRYITPKLIYFHYLEKYFLDESIQNIFYLFLNKEAPVLLFQPKCRSGHPEDNLFSLQTKHVCRIKVSKIIWFNFEENLAGNHCRVLGSFHVWCVTQCQRHEPFGAQLQRLIDLWDATVTSPRKLVISIITKPIIWIQVSKKQFILFWKRKHCREISSFHVCCVKHCQRHATCRAQLQRLIDLWDATVTSPRKLLIFIIKKPIIWIQVSKKQFILFWQRKHCREISSFHVCCVKHCQRHEPCRALLQQSISYRCLVSHTTWRSAPRECVAGVRRTLNPIVGGVARAAVNQPLFLYKMVFFFNGILLSNENSVWSLKRTVFKHCQRDALFRAQLQWLTDLTKAQCFFFSRKIG